MKPFITVLSFLLGFCCYAQNARIIKKPIQLSGVLVAGDSLKGIPAVSIKIVKTDSIDYSYFFSVPTDKEGFFSIMVRPGDVIEFKKPGYADLRYPVPDTLTRTHTSIVQIMQSKASLQDTSQVPKVIPEK